MLLPSRYLPSVGAADALSHGWLVGVKPCAVHKRAWRRHPDHAGSVVKRIQHSGWANGSVRRLRPFETRAHDNDLNVAKRVFDGANHRHAVGSDKPAKLELVRVRPLDLKQLVVVCSVRRKHPDASVARRPRRRRAVLLGQVVVQRQRARKQRAVVGPDPLERLGGQSFDRLHLTGGG